MKILLGNYNHLYPRGSETFNITLATELHRMGHLVYVYSKFLNPTLVTEYESLKIPIVNDINRLKNIHFDIAHIHQNVAGYEIRHCFPDLPIIFSSHGVQYFANLPPLIDINIAKYLAVSREVKNNLQFHLVPSKKIHLFYNIIDSSIFRPIIPIHKTPRSVLVICQKISSDDELLIKNTLKFMNLESTFIGGSHGWFNYHRLPFYINQSDIVISSGRSAIETMFCGRIPVVINVTTDGMVTPDNFRKLLYSNFSGRSNNYKLSQKLLIEEIHKYRFENGRKLQHLASVNFSADAQTKKLIGIYRNEINNNPKNHKASDKLNHLIDLINYDKVLTLLEYKFAQNFDPEADRIKRGFDLSKILSQLIKYFRKYLV
jgi:hypothetical protein